MMPQPPEPVQPHLAAEGAENAYKPSDPSRRESLESGAQPLDRKNSGSQSSKSGKVYLVGAGPGAPGLLTLRGLECLKIADVVLYDGLANLELLELAEGAEHISVGKHGKIRHWKQDEINARMLELARAGQQVVRLKGGDPAVFARTAEELEVLAASGVDFEVVPGITAALAAASFVGIPITHRQHASAVAFITGQQQVAEPPQDIDWQALANFPGTLVFYMGVTTAEQWTTRLMQAGKPATTPAAIIRRCTWPDQTVIRCSLADVAQELTPASRLRPPVLVVIGTVAGLGDQLDWFSKLPLRGQGVLITRPRGQARELGESLRELGANVFYQPAVKIVPPRDPRPLEQAVLKVAEATQAVGVTFSSSNGVEYFWRAVDAAGLDARCLAHAKLAAVGPATAKALKRRGLNADIVPTAEDGYSAQALLKKIQALYPADAIAHWWITCSNSSGDTLDRGLRQMGASAEPVLTYEAQPVTELAARTQAGLEAGQIHFCTITSQAIARATNRLLGDYRGQVQPISLGSAISECLIDELAWPPVAQAKEHSAQSILEAIVSQRDWPTGADPERSP